MHSTATKIFKVLMVCLLVASSSRGRIHRSIAIQDYVEDYHSADPDEHEVMQDIEKRSPEFDQQDDIASYSDVPNDQTRVKRQSCHILSGEYGVIPNYQCKPGCCCTRCTPCGPSSG
ncbi:hypothetical protein OS493_005720 [Desmophyllum pertusum]|uniref:Uncharacterized protein n=1 Tax=Desmophyllum pertusum TaxID=174260 RepID=A0A9W9YFJ5_9CNID|nr:hypothetical protein OS493_005720 [Desmophyllum pertusum]